MAVGVQQQQRRDTEANWVTSGKVLANGEIGYATDSHIIKMGDGVNTWDDLTIPYDGRYLPIGGKAADSEMLDGISSGGFLLVGDASTAATADKVAKRDGSGRLKAATGVSTDDVVNFAQMTIGDSQVLVSRTIAAAATLALTDLGKMIIVNNSSYTTFALNIPVNSSVAFPVGSWVDIFTSNKGPITLTPAGGVTLTGQTILYGGGSSLRLVKIATDAWIVHRIDQSPGPVLRRKAKANTTTLTSGQFELVRLDGADSGTSLFSNNADTLGANEQYNSATDLYKCYCRRSGWYDVTAQTSLGLAGIGRIYVQLRVNNIVQHLGTGISRASNADITSNFNARIPLNVGDYVEMYTFHEASGTNTISDEVYASSFFEWCWQRPL